MFRGISRSSFIIVLAACNLLFWVAVAAGVGLAVSREVDLGVETLIREQQAAAAKAWQQVASGAPRVTAVPTMATAVAALATPAPTAVEIGAVQTSVAQAGGPTATETDYPSPALTSAPTSTPRALPTENLAPSPEPLTPAPTDTLLKNLLLISDEPFSNLAHMGEEMNRSAAGRPVLIRYSEAMLNSEIASMFANNPDLPYRNVQVDLKKDQVVVTGDVMLVGFEFSTEVEGTILVEDCHPHTEIQAISIAGVLTPGFVKDQAREMLVEALDWYPADYALCLEQIVLEEERVTVYGHRR